jgi:hypothetical protein
VARDLWAKLSWVSADERDGSLRVRFSFGSEERSDWRAETRRTPWAERFAAAVFPECAALTGSRALVALVERCAGRALCFSERIVYSNAPGGGAAFHHDAEPRQLGVLYGQLAGATAWLALPKRELAVELAAFVRGTRLARRARSAERALAWLDDEEDPALRALLDDEPRFTARLVARGACLCLCAGDALLLPSPGAERACWHSVFALGARPSLAHSYGVFPAAPGRRA